MNVVLVGMMGAGKTTAGKRLARECGLSFIDLDKEIERRTGVTVSTIFEIEGEAGFRARESQLLAEVSARSGWVVATGGGVVLSPANRARLLAAPCVIYLSATPTQIYSRTRPDRSRPLLQVSDPLGRITQLVVRRDPLYREVADSIIETGRDISTVMDNIKSDIARACKH